MSDEIKDNILSSSQWLRILTMVMYALICWVVGIVIICLVLGQALFSLITAKDNEHLRHAGNISTLYFYQMLRFLTYCSEEKPFPFSSLPDADEESSAGEELSAHKEPSTHKEPASSATAGFDDDVFADISFTASDDDEKKPEGSE